MLVSQLCLTFCSLMDCSSLGFSDHGIPQARILSWVAIPFSRGSSWPRDQTRASCIAGRFFTIWDTSETQEVVKCILHFKVKFFYSALHIWKPILETLVLNNNNDNNKENSKLTLQQANLIPILPSDFMGYREKYIYFILIWSNINRKYCVG